MSNELRESKPALFVSAFAILFLLAILSYARNLHPPVNREDLERGARVQKRVDLLLDGISSHPTGSEANALVRDRLLAMLRAEGLEPVVESRFVCSRYGSCAQVENIVARVPSGKPGPPLLVATHYDSVPAGAGAGDDILGVASTLEALRTLDRSTLARDVIFLIDDGEEAGLLGAQAYVAEHGKEKTYAVLNFEARGTSGQLLMFETSQPNGGLIALYRRLARGTASGSLFAAIYEQLPNDTDFTVFRDAGMSGLNFAVIGDVAHYHTTLDSPSNLDRRTVAQYATGSANVINTFAAEGGRLTRGPSTYFDVLQLFVAAWPRWLDFVLLGLAIILTGIAFRNCTRVNSRRAIALAFAVAIGVFITAAGIGILMSKWLASDAGPWTPSPIAGLISLLLLVSALIAFAPTLVRGSQQALISSVALLTIILSFVLLVALPGGAYVMIIPAVLIAAAASGSGSRARMLTPIVALVFAGVILIPLAPGIYDALGFSASPLITVLLLTVSAPVLAIQSSIRTRRIAAAALATLALVAGLFHKSLPSVTADQPLKVNVTSVHTETGATVVSRAYARMKAGFRSPAEWESIDSPFPWFDAGHFRHRLQKSNHPLPDAVVDRVGPTSVRIEIRSRRPSDRAAFSVREGKRIHALRVNGTSVDPGRAVLANGWIRVMNRTHRTHPTVIEFETVDDRPLDAVVEDQKFEKYSSMRSSLGAPYQDGDLSIAMRSVRVNALVK